MRKHAIPGLGAIAVTALLAQPLLAQDQGADTVVATVDGLDITLGQVIVMGQNLPEGATGDMTAQARWDLLLDQLIRQAAVAGEASEADDAALRAQIELQRRNLLANAVIDGIAQADPDPDQIQAAYDRLFVDTDPVTEFSAAHILVETEEQAQTIRAELEEGADFASMAQQHSTDNSGLNDGDLGWFTPDQMVEPFGNAVQELEPGELSQPVQTQFGWHLIRLNDTRLREAPALDDIRDQLDQMVRRDNVEAAIEGLVDDAAIEMNEAADPAWLEQTDLLEAD